MLEGAPDRRMYNRVKRFLGRRDQQICSSFLDLLFDYPVRFVVIQRNSSQGISSSLYFTTLIAAHQHGLPAILDMSSHAVLRFSLKNQLIPQITPAQKGTERCERKKKLAADTS